MASLSGSNGSAHGRALSSVATARMLAATAPVGAVAVQLGTLVKLVRVLMLGSVVLGLFPAGTALARRGG